MKKIIPISVIIPTYNRTKVLFETVRSLNSGRCVPKEIIVVDQTVPPIEFPVQIREELGKRLIVINAEIPSSTKARNIGLRKANCDTVLFCDDDILINEDTLAILYETIKQEKVALVAGIHKEENVLYEGKKRHLLKAIGGTVFGMQKFWRQDGYVVHGSMRGRYANEIENIVPTEWAMGYFFCIKKTICEKYNIYFDEKLKRYAYAEDLDFTLRYCQKAKMNQLKTYVDPHIYVNHLASKEWRTPSYEATLFAVANRWYLSYKIFPKCYWYRWFLNWSDWCYEHFISKDLVEKQNWHKVRQLCKQKKRYLKNGQIEKIYF